MTRKEPYTPIEFEVWKDPRSFRGICTFVFGSRGLQNVLGMAVHFKRKQALSYDRKTDKKTMMDQQPREFKILLFEIPYFAEFLFGYIHTGHAISFPDHVSLRFRLYLRSQQNSVIT